MLAAPAASALAADTYVDQAIGEDSNLCLDPALPCATIGAALAKAAIGETVRVAPGVYSEQLTLGDGKSIRATGTPASTIITATTSPTIIVTGAAGTIEGFTLRSAAPPTSTVVQLAAAVTLEGNVFDTDVDAGVITAVRIGTGAQAAVVERNSFVDDGDGVQTAVIVGTSGTPVIADNRIDGHSTAVGLSEGSVEITNNVITGNTGTALNLFPTAGSSSVPIVSGNYINDSVGGIGIQIIDGNNAALPTVGATLRRNRIDGGSTGVYISGVGSPVTLDSHLVTATTTRGLDVRDTGQVSIENLTAWGNTSADIQLTDASLNIDSSIVEDQIVVSTASCGITFSRGPTTAGGHSCDFFTTTAAPSFMSASDFHLTPSSTAMIDQGNPAAPTGTADFEGDPRQSNTNCTSGGERRDMGADEFLACGLFGATISSPTGDAVTDATPRFTFTGGGVAPTLLCSIDESFPVICGSPRTYVGLADGPHTFSVRNAGQNGNGVTVTRTFTVDGSAPDTGIDSGPAAAATTGPSTSFGFFSEPGATFQCSIDDATFSACASGAALNGLSDGPHTFVVRAVDSVGNVDPTPVSRTWTVDATPPETSIDSGPADGVTTTETTAAYGFSSEAGATFECAIDGGGFTSCVSPRVLVGLGVGTHSFAARAIDQHGNVDSTAASRSLVIAPPADRDTKMPETTIKKVKVKRDRAKAKFSADEPAATFECKLDKAKYKPCSSPKRYRKLDSGKHKLRVRATDAAGNVDSTPARKRFRV